MKYNQLLDLTLNSTLDKNNFARIFDVVLRGLNSYYNICKTIRFLNIENILPEYYLNYLVKPKDTWTNISYNFYNTYKLWWLICKFNNIKNPFLLLQLGKIIKIPKSTVVNQIISRLDQI